MSSIAYNAVLDAPFSDESATEPVTLEDAKEWCRIDVADDDTLIERLIKASRLRLERATNVSFIPRTVTARLHNGLGGITLPYGPLVNLVSIVDADGDAVETDNYTLRGTAFPQLDTDYDDEVTVVYEAGYEELPEDMRDDLLNQIAYAYENRGDLPQASKLSPLLTLSYSRK